MGVLFLWGIKNGPWETQFLTKPEKSMFYENVNR